jgi:hypothetical protein
MEQVLPPELQFWIVSPGSIAAVPVPAFSVADELPQPVITGNIRPHTNNSELFIAASLHPCVILRGLSVLVSVAG